MPPSKKTNSICLPLKNILFSLPRRRCTSVRAIFVTVHDAIIVTFFNNLISRYGILIASPFLFSHSYCLSDQFILTRLCSLPSSKLVRHLFSLTTSPPKISLPHLIELMPRMKGAHVHGADVSSKNVCVMTTDCVSSCVDHRWTFLSRPGTQVG